MPAIGSSVASDLAAQLLTFYVKKGPLSQTTQDKPLLRILTAKAETFPGGKDNISVPVQFKFMDTTSGFYAGYSEDDALGVTQDDSKVRAAYPWKELAATLLMTWTELKKDGITVLDSNKTREHKNAEAVRITTSVFKNRLATFGESLARARQKMLWKDGTQDAKAIPGLTSILTDTPATGTCGGLDRSDTTNYFGLWQHRARVGGLAVSNNTGPRVQASKTDQTLTKTLRAEMRQLRRFGGAPDTWLAGSKFIEALEEEVFEKGTYTQVGFANADATKIDMGKISLRGVGTCEYDPTLDDLSRSKFSYIFDSSHIKLRPMENEWNKILNPERPYDQAIFLQTVTDTGGMVCDQLNCNGVYEIV